jgi:hypothetical protein
MSDTQTSETTDTGAEGDSQQEQQTFTQADVDRIVKERVKRTEAKYADYSELKEKADGAKTLEDRLADLESQHSAAQQRALRAEIANAHGISAEDRDLFLTGTDEETLTAQAKRLADRESERKKNGNHVSSEGTSTKQQPTDDEDEREFARNLFGGGS